MSRALAAYEPCGCCAWISVLGYDDAGTYKEAGAQAKRGCRIENVDVDEWKAKSLYCSPDHEAQGGPAHWPSVKARKRELAKAAKAEARGVEMGL